MAKGVLGNDPFKRGAAQRDEVPRPAEPPKPPEPTPAPAPAAAKKKAEAKPEKQWPTAAKKNQPARESVRSLMSAKKAPVLDGPPERIKDWEPTSHADSPELLAQLQQKVKEFFPHPNAPELMATLNDAIATAHSGSPEAVIVEGATAHRDSPEVIADLDEDRAVAHPLSPEVVEIRPVTVHPESSRGASATAMSDREISSEAPRGSDPMAALGFARDLAGGIARPLAGAAKGLFQAARAAIGLGGGTELDMWGRDASLTRNLEPLSDFLYQRYFRVTVEGADHVPAGASLLIGNHSGALPLDGPMLYLALQRERADLSEVRWLIEDQVFHAPFIGVLANRLGAVRANPENATRLLEEKRPVAVFPEGIHGLSKPFSERYQLKRFGRGGYVKLAVRHNVPIVPVAIVGAEESMPLLARLPGGFLGLPYLPVTPPPLPARWHIRFGPPIDLSSAPDNAEEDLAWVAQINDRTRETIEGMLTAMLRARTSVF
jgi:1-acyl-sn-glycerol-3-phosphate acyltransferase